MDRTLCIFLIGVCLLLSGCLVDQDSPEACRYGVDRALSDGHWDKALHLLDQRGCEVSFSPDERSMALAAAYIGKAGYDLPALGPKILRQTRVEDDRYGAQRLLLLFADFRPAWDSLTHLRRAQEQHRDLMAPYQGSMERACRRSNLPYLSRTQRDACFYFGLTAIAQAVSAIALLAPEDIQQWVDGDMRSCEIDANRSRRPDSAEASACAIDAASAPTGLASGSCPSTAGGDSVSWHRPARHPEVRFYDQGIEVARVEPLRVDIAPGGRCEAGRSEYRLLYPERERSLVLTTGYCTSTDITQSCDAADPDADCWPCPVLQPGSRALAAQQAVIEGLNYDVEALFAIIPESELQRARQDVDALKQNLCDRLEAVGGGCSLKADGDIAINEQALKEFFRQGF